MAQMRKDIVGWLEQVSFPEFGSGPEEIIAKIDTGADSGAVHCVFQNVVKDETGREVVEFQPLHEDYPVIKTDKFCWVRVRSSNGVHERRPRIDTTINIRGKDYPVQLSLTDRKDMKYDVIVGRRFLENKFLVDVSKTNI